MFNNIHKKLMGTGLLAGSLFLVACGSDIAASEYEPRVVAVNTQLVSTGHLATHVSFVGQVYPQEQVNVIGRIPQGMVDQVFVSMGDFVNAGDPLFTMDLTDINNQIAALTAQLVTAEAGVRAAQTGVGQATAGGGVQQQAIQAGSGVAQAQTGVAQAEAGVSNAQIAIEQSQTNINQARLGMTQAQNAYDTASQNLADSTVLFHAGAMSRVQLDQAEIGTDNARLALEQATNNYNIANTAIEQANIGLATAQATLAQAQQGLSDATASYQIMTQTLPGDQLNMARDGLAQAQANRNALKVQLNTARAALNDAVITSPITGVVNSRNVEPGTMLMGGLPPFTIVSENTVEVRVEVTQSVINSVNVGDTVTVFVPATQNESFPGQVMTVSPAANGTRTFTVAVNVDNQTGTIRPGMFAEVLFTMHEIQNGIIIPRQAVLTQGADTVVYLANGESAKRTYVTTGLDDGMVIEITSGLQAGDELIITGQNFVNHGTLINVIERIEA